MVTTTKQERQLKTRTIFEAIDYPICDYIHRKTAMKERTETRLNRSRKSFKMLWILLFSSPCSSPSFFPIS